ncbi:MAG: phage tail protein [Anaerolineae bacterium]
MAKQIPAEAASLVKHIDSLSANEFMVEMDDMPIDGIFRVVGLVPFKLEVKSTSALKATKDSFQIVKMVRRDPQNPFNTWLRESVNTKTDIVRPTRTLVIIAVDDGNETRRWVVKGAWISAVSYSDFNTGSGELVEETLTIQWDDIETVWPGS